MKQLLDTCDAHIVVGLIDRAFVVKYGSDAVELVAPNQDDDKEEALDIQAVAMAKFGDSYWCAVSHFNKTLSLYCIDEKSETLEPTTVHKTNKRCLCLEFASVPSESTTGSPLHIIIAGDLVGDATAYPLTIDSNEDKETKSKVLLGHTASMLTSVQVVTDETGKQRILTSDRDEKVRISSFPQTTIIEGFLLGHQAFISCMSACSTTGKCVTCSGDNTIRLWDYLEGKELAVLSTNRDSVPTRVAFCGTMAAVIYDQCKKIDFMSVYGEDKMELFQTRQCPEQPLGIQFSSSSEKRKVLVLCQNDFCEYNYVVDNEDAYSEVRESKITEALVKVGAFEQQMPSSIMETDNKGQYKLQKLNETRGWAGDEKPWNRVERVQKAKDANSRRKRKKREEVNEEE